MDATLSGDGIGSTLLRGAVAGVLGGIAMKAVLEMAERSLLPPGRQPVSPPGEVVRRMETARDLDLSSRQTQLAEAGVHIGYSALWGAAQGLVTHSVPLPSAVRGLLLGGAIYYVTVGPKGVLTRAGLAPSPLLQPMAEAAVPLGAHLAYGIATAAAYEALS